MTPRTAWTAWCAAAAATLSLGGLHWDLSWHRSIGRDTLWTPAHIAIQSAGLLAGLTGAWLILDATWFGRQAAAVRVWGFRGPLGAFVWVWGALAMAGSFPFDDWWHRTYGLDVRIMSPPHAVLVTGVLAVKAGALLLIAREAGRVGSTAPAALRMLVLYAGSTAVGMLLFLTLEYGVRIYMRTATFYVIVSVLIPMVLEGVPPLSGFRWGRTALAAIYSAFNCLFVWLPPLFSARPELSPVYREVTRFVPSEFPLLLIAPALAMDAIGPRLAGLPRWRHATAGGLLFLAAFVAAQWPFAGFLQSPASRNAFFGTGHLAYNLPDFSYMARYEFVPPEPNYAVQWVWAAVGAIVSMRIGAAWCAWLSRVRR